MTDLDDAHAAMAAAPEDDSARLRFYERLADTELFVLLEKESEGDQIAPALFDIEDQKYALVFDREERLSGFVGRTAPYAGLAGRALVGMLQGHEIGLALNLEVAPSAMLIPPEAVGWLANTVSHAPQQTTARLLQVAPPANLPPSVVTGLDRKLATATGLAQAAYLATATYADGTQGDVLVFVDAVDGAEHALATAVNEAMTFSGADNAMLDVVFARTGDPLVAHLARVGLRFDLPQPVAAQPPAAPGMDPAKPPRLR